MESSTTRPIATVMAPSVIMFSVISICFITETAINKESGIETTEINVVRIFRRNNMIITIAKIAPKIALLSIVSTDFSIGAPWSNVEMISKSLYFSQGRLLCL